MTVTLHDFRQNNPSIFTGIDLNSDPQDFLDVCSRLCVAFGCSPARAVELTDFQFQGVAYRWYETLLRSRPVGNLSLLLAEFYDMFLERFLPDSLRETKAESLRC